MNFLTELAANSLLLIAVPAGTVCVLWFISKLSDLQRK